MPFYAAFAAGALASLLTASTDTVPTVEVPPRAWYQLLAAPGGEEHADPGVVLRSAALQLKLGAPERARALLSGYVPAPTAALAQTVYRLYAAAAYADSDYASAARFFAAAARRAGGPRRGVLEARAADAFDRAGLSRPAAVYYRAALRRLPEVSDWIAIRLARLVPDTSIAFALLRRATPAASRVALETRAALLSAVGAAQAAEAELVAAGRAGLAAQFALMTGDAPRAQRLALQALAGADTAEAAVGLDLLASANTALTGAQCLTVARALQRRGRQAEAASLFGRVARGGDSTPGVLLALGTALEGAGNRQAALRAYDAVARAGDSAAAASAEYQRGRLLMRSGRSGPGLAALTAFVRRHPAHGAVPSALIAIADARLRAGSRRRADSLYEAVARSWPRSPVASEARFRLGGRALRSGDLARAASLYTQVVQEEGPSALAARYALGRLAQQRRDTAAARAQWRALAQDDPLGYYGILARQAAGLQPLAFQDPGPPSATPTIERAVAALGLLDAIGFDGEAGALVDYLTSRTEYTPDQLLELASGMLARGRMTVAASLGWQAARGLSLEDPRVLRVIFPWPWRQVIEAEAREFGIDPYVLAAVIRQESGFRRAVVSRAGAWGLMQLMPGTARMTASRLGLPWRERLLTVPDANVHVGAAHLAMLLRRYRGGLVRALAAYNAGGRPVSRWARNPGAQDAFWFVEEIPYPETRGYVRSVVRNVALYEALYPRIAVR